MKGTFNSWLIEEIQRRGWPQAEFARRAGLSPATVSRVISGENGPGDEFVAGTAQALGLPAEAVMRLMGKLPELGEVLPEAREWSARLMALGPERRAAAMQAIANIMDLADNRADQEGRGGRPAHRRRPVRAEPPDQVEPDPAARPDAQAQSSGG